MPETNDALYSRGRYRLEWDRKRDGALRSPFLQIVWYDEEAGRNRSRTTGTADIEAAESALDALYLEREKGQAICPTCLRPLDGVGGYLVANSIADYLEAKSEIGSIESIRPRLAHVTMFLDQTDRLETLTCDEVDEALIAEFRTWSAKQPVIEGTKNPVARDRAPGTTEGSVRQWAAALNFSYHRKDTRYPAGFKARKTTEVSQPPTYRSSVEEMAKMFHYCLYPQPPKGQQWSEKMRKRQIEHRANLLRFLQASVATWARPDAAHDISTDPKRAQWIAAAGVVQLNPKGRRQTRKYRPAVPVPGKFGRLLDQTTGFFVTVDSVRKAFDAMLDELGLPRERETGLKLIRRSMATIARKRLTEEHWIQGKMMMGHVKAEISDLYALPDPANLGRALRVTSEIIDEIEVLCPGAFTGATPELQVVGGTAA